MGVLVGSTSTDSVNEGSAAILKCRFKRNSTFTTPVCGVNWRIDDLTEDVVIKNWTMFTDPITGSEIRINLTSHDNMLYNNRNKAELRSVTVSASFGSDNFATGTFKFYIRNLISVE